MTLSIEQLQQVGTSGKVVTTSGDKIGGIGQIYVDDDTSTPTWVTVKTGLFGTSESFVPLEDARVEGDDIVVGYDKDTIKDAPRVDADGAITPDEEESLYRHYGLASGTTTGAGTGTGTTGTNDRSSGYDAAAAVGTSSDRVNDHGTQGHDTSGPTTDDAMTLSEERLRVGKETRESGRARLRKYVTTEKVTQTVPLRHEEVTLEREPITDANAVAAGSGPAISEEEHEVVLHEERVVVDKDVVATERVRLGTKTVTENETVSADLRKENIDLDTDTDTGRNAR